MEIFLSIIIPVYNEQNRISNTIKKTIDYFSKKNFNFEIIIVNDGSTDNTISVVKRNIKELKNNLKNDKISILNNKINKGKGFSVRRGAIASKGQFVLFTDADLSTPIEEFEKLSSCLKNGYNIAIGSRGLKDSKIIIRQNKIRESMGKFFNILVRIITNLNYKDTQCGFKCFDRKSINLISPHLKINGFSFDVEILYLAKKLGLKVSEIPIKWINNSNSKVSTIRSPINMFIDLLKIKNIH